MTTLALQTLPPVSSLESYIQAVNAVPMLTPERELELGRRRARPGGRLGRSHSGNAAVLQPPEGEPITALALETPEC